MADDAMTTRTVNAYHEAGHVVYAYLVGMEISGLLVLWYSAISARTSGLGSRRG